MFVTKVSDLFHILGKGEELVEKEGDGLSECMLSSCHRNWVGFSCALLLYFHAVFLLQFISHFLFFVTYICQSFESSFSVFLTPVGVSPPGLCLQRGHSYFLLAQPKCI